MHVQQIAIPLLVFAAILALATDRARVQATQTLIRQILFGALIVSRAALAWVATNSVRIATMLVVELVLKALVASKFVWGCFSRYVVVGNYFVSLISVT